MEQNHWMEILMRIIRKLLLDEKINHLFGGFSFEFFDIFLVLQYIKKDSGCPEK